VNSYYKVSSATATNVILGEPVTGLNPGDKVILMQMTGITYDSTSPAGFPTASKSFSGFANAGKYVLLSIKSVNAGSKQVDFTASIPAPINFTFTEKVQLVKIYEADYAQVDSVLTSDPWDGNKGGVLALVIFKKLKLNSNIDVSEKGFRGASPDTAPSIICRPSNPTDTFYFRSYVIGKTGKKGEGNISASWKYTKGPGRNMNGGGGGLGQYAGGGGGGNYEHGGDAGMQYNCAGTPQPAWFADGGFGLKINNFYDTITYPLVSMGGGGGSSVQFGSHKPFIGGNGGGIVIIITDTLQTLNNSSIISNGGNVSDNTTSGGAGGGAGGSVLLDINVYINKVRIFAKGGKGGNTIAANTGGGGGGGGGIHWYAGKTLSSNIVDSLSKGIGGNKISSLFNLRGNDGLDGGTLKLLKLPLNGFLFNSVTATDTICTGQSPKKIIGSVPKGGKATYIYTWIKSSDSISWSHVTTNADSLSLTSDPLDNTTWFTRIVQSGSIVDTALPEKVFVYPALSGNVLANRDTLCFNTSPGILTGTPLNGGNSVFSYLWQSSVRIPTWVNRSNNINLSEGKLDSTTYYRRIVTSAIVCTSTSNIDTITVLDTISNNSFFRADTAICANLNAGIIRANYPSGGDLTYSYQWLDGYAPIPSANQQNYSPGSGLTSDKYFRRVVLSGNGHVCRDTTSAFFIEVYPTLGNNIISTDSSRFCAGDNAHIITEVTPTTGGDSPSYSYRWREKGLHTNWTTINNASSKNYTPSAFLVDTILFNRVVTSGRFSACFDTNGLVQINVIPYIINNLVTIDSAICEGASPKSFAEGIATGGAGGYIYQWKSKPLNGGSWQLAPTNASPNNLAAYSSGTLDESTLFRREVASQICNSISNNIKITVYPHLTNNIIQGGNLQYVCDNSSKQLIGLTPSGGNTPYYKYNWQQSNDESFWIKAAGEEGLINYNSPPSSDSSYYRRIVKSGDYDQCIDTSFIVLLRINSLPSGSIVSKNDTLCAGSNITIQHSLQGHSPWNLVVGDQTFNHTKKNIQEAVDTISFALSQSMVIKILDVQDDSLCHAAPTSLSGLVNAKVFDIPIANAGTNDQVCGLNYTMAADMSGSAGIGVWTSQDATFDNPTSPTAKAVAKNYGTGVFRWTVTNWHCTDNKDVSIEFFKQPATPNAGTDATLDYTFTYKLNPGPVDAGSGNWISLSEDATIENNTIANFNKPGNYLLVWTVENGVCTPMSDTLKITVGDLKIYNGFSPNGDGKNEEFILKLSGRYTSELTILNGWGGVVFKTSGVDEVKWDGKNNDGNPLPVGTYYFILKEPGVTERTGYIELRR